VLDFERVAVERIDDHEHQMRELRKQLDELRLQTMREYLQLQGAINANEPLLKRDVVDLQGAVKKLIETEARVKRFVFMFCGSFYTIMGIIHAIKWFS
jgi:hypothetical protein